MKKGELIKGIESSLKEESPFNNVEQSQGIGQLFFKEGIIFASIFAVLFIISILIYNKVSNLSPIRPIFVLVVSLVLMLICIASILYGTILKKKDNVFQYDVRREYNIYQIFDCLKTVGTVTAIFSLIILCVLTPAEVSGDSMLNTYYDHDRVLVWQLGYTPTDGDVVIIDTTIHNLNVSENTEFIIKRVVATSGDQLIYSDGKLYVNGKLIHEGINETQLSNMTTFQADKTIKCVSGVVPEGYSIVLGDNRSVSNDSRYLGMISNEDIVGKTVLTLYPFSHFGIAKENHKS